MTGSLTAVGGFWMLGDGVKIGSPFSESPIHAPSIVGYLYAWNGLILQDRFSTKGSEGGGILL